MAIKLSPQGLVTDQQKHNADYYENNREALLEKCKVRYKKDPKKYTDRAKSWYWNNHEKALEFSKLQRAKHATKIKESALRYHSKPENRVKILNYSAARRAKLYSLEYSDDILEYMLANIPTDCKCCGKILDYSRGTGNNQNAPSIDRVDSSRGYTIDNIAVICVRCNLVKNAGTAEEHEMIARYIRGK